MILFYRNTKAFTLATILIMSASGVQAMEKEEKQTLRSSQQQQEPETSETTRKVVESVRLIIKRNQYTPEDRLKSEGELFSKKVYSDLEDFALKMDKSLRDEKAKMDKVEPNKYSEMARALIVGKYLGFILDLERDARETLGEGMSFGSFLDDESKLGIFFTIVTGRVLVLEGKCGAVATPWSK